MLRRPLLRPIGFDEKEPMGRVAAPDTTAPTSEQTLGRWVGFRVDTPEGPFGTVLCELRHGRCGRPACVVVRRGLFCERHTIVPLSEIDSVFPAEHRIVLRAAFRTDMLDERLCRPSERRQVAAGNHR